MRNQSLIFRRSSLIGFFHRSIKVLRAQEEEQLIKSTYLASRKVSKIGLREVLGPAALFLNARVMIYLPPTQQEATK